MKKKGFTLIELLSVIVILAVIALIATPLILNIIDSTRTKANRNSIYGFLESARVYYMNALLDSNNKEIVTETTNLIDKIEISTKKPDNGEIYVNNEGEIATAIVLDNVCYSKDFSDSDLSESDDIENCVVDLGPTVPMLTIDNKTNNSITVTAACSDMITGVKKIELSIDGGKTYSTFKMVNSLLDMNRYNFYGSKVTKENIYEGNTLIDKFDIYNVTNATSNGPYYIVNDKNPLIIGKEYTWSAYVKLNRELTFSSFGHEQGGTINPKLLGTTEWQKVSYTFVAKDWNWNEFIMYGPFVEGDSIYVHSATLTEVDSDNSVGTYQYTFDNLSSGTYDIKARCTSYSEKISESEILQVKI